jgi:hypothetical protein
MFVYIKENEMKKVALSLLAFALVGALAVAQDAPTLKLSGYLNSGVRIDAVGSAAVSTIYGDDAGNAWGRFDLNGSYGTDTNGVEWKLRTANNTTAPNLEFAYAWSKFADGMVTVKAGKVDDGTFTTAGDIGADFTDANGIAVAVTPAAGFSVGANWILPTADLSKSPTTPLVFAVSAAFSADKLAKAEAAGKISASKLSEILIGFGLLAVDKLTFAVDAKLSSLDVSGSNAAYKISENVSYAVSDALSVGVLAYEYAWGSDIKVGTDTPFGFDVKPNVSYTVDPMVSVGAGVKYHMGPNSDGFYDNKASWVDVNPSATFTLSPAAKIIASYNLGYSLDKDKANYDLADQKDQALAHTLKVDFRYNF